MIFFAPKYGQQIIQMSVVEIVGGAHFADNYNGLGSGLTSIPRTGILAGTANQVIVNDGTGALSSVALLNPARGGTGVDTSASTGILRVTAGVWSAAQNISNADIAANAAISRAKLATGTANQVVVNDGTGAFASLARLTPVLGGTGIDTSASTGILRVTAGVWSAAQNISDADIAAGAAISRAKIAAGTANHVVVNDGTGLLTSIAILPSAQGGTGANLSAIAGPAIASVTNGVFSAALSYGTAAVANSIVQRDANGFVNLGTTSTQTPTTIAGGNTFTTAANVQTTNATATNIISLPVPTGGLGVHVNLTAVDSTGAANTGFINYYVKAKNVGGTVTASALLQKGSILDPGFTIDSNVVASGTNLAIRVVGIAATNINWCGMFEVITQQF